MTIIEFGQCVYLYMYNNIVNYSLKLGYKSFPVNLFRDLHLATEVLRQKWCHRGSYDGSTEVKCKEK